ncbi:PssE/Cps14G family polysaccharide biosynthesis glycosyltransferase [Clostridium perfringens]|uniref:PssE/Cps14G family polysaccharide biosynthesis glycosyltransferase n=1 Tax=Clostridium perfringens TaxID=1502 RepID=UPI000F521F44|nr:PssE/Cps14G family polysaccharide biosynthesis glycosyltransferase [Clostridium perfringens]EJT6501169.1 beta(1,3)galactosyltransferase EpsH [Clostridium perfringens]MDK3223019.1 PssE/Cps14G family polysaccharide biosynthesis glycosyltransferase [Clostridium perfringens]MDM0833112.1 PssE/Cps14G family polysaccharide biosynthesis glycosyltransferase [Clostridium perfringens]MDZ4991097.1 beta(1,3)galactosyltransferase EpsH [Clostridium perfringens]RQN16239.1 beta(1,3)galactosyltransferase Eps
MIFVTLGSQKFQFNRLLKEIDILIDKEIIKEEVFAQIGYSTYIPKNYKYKNFLNRDEFSNIMKICDKVITHGGTGAIIGAVKKNKKVIAIPRNMKFNEHVDNHQYEIVNEFANMNFILGVNEIEDLNEAIKSLDKINFKEYKSNTQVIVDNIDNFISKI